MVYDDFDLLSLEEYNSESNISKPHDAHEAPIARRYHPMLYMLPVAPPGPQRGRLHCLVRWRDVAPPPTRAQEPSQASQEASRSDPTNVVWS